MIGILNFLRQLQPNNNREWFKAHSADYEHAKDALLQLSTFLIENSNSYAPELKTLLPKSCMFRIHRDVRFSKNKAPYKNNMGAYFAPGGRKSIYAGYYVHLQPDASFVAGGLWMPEPQVLQLVRQEIYYRYQDFIQITESSELKKIQGLFEGDKLKNPPKGYDKHHPAIEWLKMKSFIISVPFSDKMVEKETFAPTVSKYFKAMAPWVNFLNQAIDMQE